MYPYVTICNHTAAHGLVPDTCLLPQETIWIFTNFRLGVKWFFQKNHLKIHPYWAIGFLIWSFWHMGLSILSWEADISIKTLPNPLEINEIPYYCSPNPQDILSKSIKILTKSFELKSITTSPNPLQINSVPTKPFRNQFHPYQILGEPFKIQ